MCEGEMHALRRVRHATVGIFSHAHPAEVMRISLAKKRMAFMTSPI